MELSALYRDAQDLDARIYPYNIGFAGAATIETAGRYGIFVDFDRLGSLQEFKAALAHELGHCATGCTHRVSSPYDLVCRHEYKANRWAIQRYLPFEELQRAMSAGYTEPWQLAEYFQLPEAAVRRALNCITVRHVDAVLEAALDAPAHRLEMLPAEKAAPAPAPRTVLPPPERPEAGQPGLCQ